MTTKKILILGGGFGGIYAALTLEKFLARRPELEVTLVTRENYFLFTPMLPEVAAGELELNTIVNPLRKLLKRVKTFVGTIEAINLQGRQVAVSHGLDGHSHELSYDQLILALGAGTNFFNLPGVEDCCITMKTLGDAVAIRNQLITHLEEANSECAAGERQPLLTFVVVGGGFAGVETVGGINDFVREAIRFYPNLRPEYLRFILVTPDEIILPELNRKLGIYAQRKLAARGVAIITHARVSAMDDGVVELTNGDKIPANTLIWTAGTAPNPLVAGPWMKAWRWRAGRKSGQSEIARRFPTRRANFIHPLPSMPCAKETPWHAMSSQPFTGALKGSLSVTLRSGSSLRSAAAPASPTSWE
jgi:NADH dehydrogenase